MTGLYFATSVQISTLLTNWSHSKLKTVGSDSAGLTQSGSLNVKHFLFLYFLKTDESAEEKGEKKGRKFILLGP